MKTHLLLTALLSLPLITLAQQPFKEYGYEVKIATLSNGKYIEHFDQDTLVQIGSVIINRLNGKIVSFVVYDTVYNESDLRPELISRWWSPDPLADEFYNESPYNFSHNNPIRYNDPTGLAPNDVILTGSEKGTAFNELQKSVEGKLNLSMDGNGKVTYTQVEGSKLNGDAKQLTAAIDDHNVIVVVDAHNNKTDSKGRLSIGGSFEGNKVIEGGGQGGTTQSVIASQEINPNVLSAADTYYGKPGANTLHEVTEAYQGGRMSLDAGISSGDANTPGSVYNRAHNAATNQSGPIFETVYNASGSKLPGGVYTGAVRAEYSVQKGTKKPLIIMTYPK